MALPYKARLKNMQGYIDNIEKVTKENDNFRKVLYTGKNSQLVVMNLKPGEEIGQEVHDLDQFIRIEEGQGKAVLGEKEYLVEDDWALVVPSGTNHNIVNTSPDRNLKLYTIYSPPEHKDGTIQATKQDALDGEEHFNGKTTE